MLDVLILIAVVYVLYNEYSKFKNSSALAALLAVYNRVKSLFITNTTPPTTKK